MSDDFDIDQRFTYHHDNGTTRVTLAENPEHNAFFIDSDLGNGDDTYVLLRQPPLYGSIGSDGKFLFHWKAKDLRQHIAICAEALLQLDYALTAKQERQYDAYIETLEVEEMLDQYQDAPYGMEER